MGFALSDLKLTSTAFAQGEPIPALHTGEGDDVSPELSWSNVPDGTASFAIICHDPDAPLITRQGNYGYVHWVLYNIPAATLSLAQGTGEHTSGTNDFGKQNYGGPMPPNGHGKHQYYFWIIALDKDLRLEVGLSQVQLLERIEPNAIGMNRLVGVYERA